MFFRCPSAVKCNFAMMLSGLKHLVWPDSVMNMKRGRGYNMLQRGWLWDCLPSLHHHLPVPENERHRCATASLHCLHGVSVCNPLQTQTETKGWKHSVCVPLCPPTWPKPVWAQQPETISVPSQSHECVCCTHQVWTQAKHQRNRHEWLNHGNGILNMSLCFILLGSWRWMLHMY